MRKRARTYLDEMGVRIPDVDAEVAQLSGGQRQSIAVARSVYSEAKIILLDEPLAAMGVKEGALILDLIRKLRDEGKVSMILILHNYAHVFEVCDRVNLLQHGEITLDKPTNRDVGGRADRARRARVPPGPGRVGLAAPVQGYVIRVLVTGAKGKVGSAAVSALLAAGHDVRASDLARGVFERQLPDEPGSTSRPT